MCPSDAFSLVVSTRGAFCGHDVLSTPSLHILLILSRSFCPRFSHYPIHSLVASVVVRQAKFLTNPGEIVPKIKTFCIGFEGAPDLIAAQKVADFLGTSHYSFTYTLQQGIDFIPQVIHKIESYDVTTVRSSTPMFIMARRIKSLGVKMVLSGEGSDEIFGGYLYFAHAKSPKDFHEECVRRVERLHLSDCLRANKSTMAWGVETRVPFLDKDFLEVVRADGHFSLAPGCI